MKITSPDTTYTGESRYGDTVLEFKDGVAEHEGDLPYGVSLYLQGAGYGIDGAKPEAPEAPVPVAPAETFVQIGTRLRDAAELPEGALQASLEEAIASGETPSSVADAPPGNASRDAWHAYALSLGFPEEGLEGRSRDEIRALINEE